MTEGRAKTKVDETESLVRAMRRSSAVRMALAGACIVALGAFFLAAAILGMRDGVVNLRLVVIGGSGLFIGAVVTGMAAVMVRRIARGVQVETNERGEPLIPPARVVPRSDAPASTGRRGSPR